MNRKMDRQISDDIGRDPVMLGISYQKVINKLLRSTGSTHSCKWVC